MTRNLAASTAESPLPELGAPVPADAPTTLVVEDEENLLFTLRYNLEREGYRVLTANRGDDGLRIAHERSPDLVVLDLMLPGLDGIQLCRQLRRTSQVPVIMLTALGGESDKVAGLEAGADDYLAKPFGMRELLARIRALLRRAGHGERVGPAAPSLRSRDIELDRERHELRRDGQSLRLKPKEFELLLFFLEHPGKVFSREQILNEVWGKDFHGNARTVDVHVRWLRQKVEVDPARPARLRTVRGSGYLFEG
ncbi:MAG: response regulator transcription factor [Dehalococcoidia bacterium]